MPGRVPTHGGGAAFRACRPYEAAARKADKRFYASTVWRKLRALCLAERPVCEFPGCNRAAEHVHHRRPRKARPDLALDRSNLQCLCEPCHNRVRNGPVE